MLGGKVLVVQACNSKLEPQNPDEKAGMVSYTYNSSFGETETGRSWGRQGSQFTLIGKLQDPLRPYLKNMMNNSHKMIC